MTTMNSLTAQLSASQQREAEFRELITVLECPNCKGVGWYMQYVRDAEELEKVECQICADIAALSASTASDFVRREERDAWKQSTQDERNIHMTTIEDRDDALAKLVKCREALARLEEVGILCQRAEEARYSDARIFARQTLEETK